MKNILLIISGDLLQDLNKAFFLNNNVVIFFSSNNNLNQNFFFGAKTFTKLTNISKFIDEVTTTFVENSLNYELNQVEKNILNLYIKYIFLKIRIKGLNKIFKFFFIY